MFEPGAGAELLLFTFVYIPASATTLLVTKIWQP